MRDGYVARWRGREYEASPDGDDVRIYLPQPDEGFEEVRPGRFVRVLPISQVDDLCYVRTACSWRGEPFIVLHGEGAKTAVRLGITEIRLSLSHSDHYAVAHALALGA